MRGLAKTISLLLSALGLQTSPWVLPAIIVVAALVLWPTIQKSQKVDRAVKTVRSTSARAAADRERIGQEALSAVQDDPIGLVQVAEEAVRVGDKALARAAVARLMETGKRPQDARRILRSLEADAPRLPVEVAVRVEPLLDAGMLAEARRRLEDGLARWPQDADLLELKQRLDQAESAVAASDGPVGEGGETA